MRRSLPVLLGLLAAAHLLDAAVADSALGDLAVVGPLVAQGVAVLDAIALVTVVLPRAHGRRGLRGKGAPADLVFAQADPRLPAGRLYLVEFLAVRILLALGEEFLGRALGLVFVDIQEVESDLRLVLVCLFVVLFIGILVDILLHDGVCVLLHGDRFYRTLVSCFGDKPPGWPALLRTQVAPGRRPDVLGEGANALGGEPASPSSAASVAQKRREKSRWEGASERGSSQVGRGRRQPKKAYLFFRHLRHLTALLHLGHSLSWSSRSSCSSSRSLRDAVTLMG